MHGKILLAGLLLLLVSIPQSSTAASLTNPLNKHNLSSGADSGHPHSEVPALGGTTEICVFCHTPHGASAQGPLWNRPDIAGSFPLYNSPTLVIDDVSGISGYIDDGSVTYPNGATRLCLSCHDGVTAINVLLNPVSPIEMSGGKAGAVNLSDFFSTAIIDLSTSHPVSFTYNTSVRDAILVQKPGLYQLPSLTDVPLDSLGRMQCTTCHDPHSDTKIDGLAYPFWRHTTNIVVDAYTDVCNTCHIPAPQIAGPVH